MDVQRIKRNLVACSGAVWDHQLLRSQHPVVVVKVVTPGQPNHAREGR